jgi:hypothetical protein
VFKDWIIRILAIAAILSVTVTEVAGQVPRSKFYDFNEQLIDGEIKKPITLYTDAREKVKFERLLKLKKSFLHRIFESAKERVFK